LDSIAATANRRVAARATHIAIENTLFSVVFPRHEEPVVDNARHRAATFGYCMNGQSLNECLSAHRVSTASVRWCGANRRKIFFAFAAYRRKNRAAVIAVTAAS